MDKRISRCVELLEQDQAIYYDGPQQLRHGRTCRICTAWSMSGRSCTPDNITARIDEGVRLIAGHSEASAIKGWAHQKRKLPV